MKKKIPILAVLILALIIVACSGKGGSNSSTTSESNENTGPDSSNDSETNTPANLPPDPGNAGKVTLEGIDSDSDGVRDDVQITIHNWYPTEEPKRKALVQEAKALQEAILVGDAQATSTAFEVAQMISNAGACSDMRGVESKYDAELELLVVNTSERADAYIEFNGMLSGHFFGDEDENPCQE